jgi:hypothetical protein
MPYDGQPVMTGHAHGVITLDASEADAVIRVKTRLDMAENYRTLVGHFRHESGHYYFDLMQHFSQSGLKGFVNTSVMSVRIMLKHLSGIMNMVQPKTGQIFMSADMPVRTLGKIGQKHGHIIYI